MLGVIRIAQRGGGLVGIATDVRFWRKADIEPENIRPTDSSLLGHYSLQAFLALCPIRHNPINECEKLRPMMRLRNMAELMRNDVVNGIHRRLDEAVI